MQRRRHFKIPITHRLVMNRDQKLQFNQQVRRSGMLVARFLKNVARLPQEVIDLILRDLKNTLRVIPLRSLTLNLPINLQQFALNPLETDSPFRAYFDRWGGPGPHDFSSLDPRWFPRRTAWANPTQFDQLSGGTRYLTNREEPPSRIVQGESGLGVYGNRLGYGSFQ